MKTDWLIPQKNPKSWNIPVFIINDKSVADKEISFLGNVGHRQHQVLSFFYIQMNIIIKQWIIMQYAKPVRVDCD